VPFQPAFVEIGQHEPRAVARQPFGDREPDALGGTGDDRNVILKLLVHYRQFFRE